MMCTVWWATVCNAVLLEPVISRPNSRDSLATTFGMEPARVDLAPTIVFDFAISEFSDRRARVLLDAFVFVRKLFEPCESCLEMR